MLTDRIDGTVKPVHDVRFEVQQVAVVPVGGRGCGGGCDGGRPVRSVVLAVVSSPVSVGHWPSVFTFHGGEVTESVTRYLPQKVQSLHASREMSARNRLVCGGKTSGTVFLYATTIRYTRWWFDLKKRVDGPSGDLGGNSARKRFTFGSLT